MLASSKTTFSDHAFSLQQDAMLRNEPLCVTGLLNKAIVHVIEPLLPPKVAMYVVEQFWKGSSSSSKHNTISNKKVQLQQDELDNVEEVEVEVAEEQ
jgi:hypothetical protein